MLVRLRPGENPEHGRQQLQAILNALIRAQVPGIKTELITQLVPIREIYAGKVRLRLLLILAASALLLLTACTNIANLFLARVASRASEFATRIALGAGRARILSQTLTETTLLAILGGALGAVIAKYGAGLLAAYGPDDVRLLADTRLNLPVFLFAMAASLVTGIAVRGLSGLAGIPEGRCADCRKAPGPLWRRPAPLSPGSGGSGDGARNGAAGLRRLAASQLRQGDARRPRLPGGARPRGGLVALRPALFDGRDRAAFYRELAGNVRALPGVLAAGAISDLPAASGSSGASRTIFHATDTDFQSLVLARPVAMIRSVTAGYFAASGTGLASRTILYRPGAGTGGVDQRVSGKPSLAAGSPGGGGGPHAPSGRCHGTADHGGRRGGRCPSWRCRSRAAAAHLSALSSMGQRTDDLGGENSSGARRPGPGGTRRNQEDGLRAFRFPQYAPCERSSRRRLHNGASRWC